MITIQWDLEDDLKAGSFRVQGDPCAARRQWLIL